MFSRYLPCSADMMVFVQHDWFLFSRNGTGSAGMVIVQRVCSLFSRNDLCRTGINLPKRAQWVWPLSNMCGIFLSRYDPRSCTTDAILPSCIALYVFVQQSRIANRHRLTKWARPFPTCTSLLTGMSLLICKSLKFFAKQVGAPFSAN